MVIAASRYDADVMQNKTQWQKDKAPLSTAPLTFVHQPKKRTDSKHRI